MACNCGILFETLFERRTRTDAPSPTLLHTVTALCLEILLRSLDRFCEFASTSTDSYLGERVRGGRSGALSAAALCRTLRRLPRGPRNHPLARHAQRADISRFSTSFHFRESTRNSVNTWKCLLSLFLSLSLSLARRSSTCAARASRSARGTAGHRLLRVFDNQENAKPLEKKETKTQLRSQGLDRGPGRDVTDVDSEGPRRDTPTRAAHARRVGVAFHGRLNPPE